MTIDELAKMCNVSKTTISRVINNKPDVNPETRKIILDLINSFGYQPNANAKAMSERKSYCVGLIMPIDVEYIFSNPFYVDVMRGISTELDKHGYYLVLCYPHEQNYIDMYSQKRVDGFILLSPSISLNSLTETLTSKNAPFVSTANLPDCENIPSVDVDNFQGGVTAVEHLISLGHTEIGFMGKKNVASSNERLRGLKYAFYKNGISYNEKYIFVAEAADLACGYETAKKMIASGNLPTAVFVASDLMCIGVMKAIMEAGFKIPQDISIVGFDNLIISNYFYPPLTTIAQPAYEKGVVAADMLVKYLQNKQKSKSIILPTKLVVRQSTSKPCRKSE